VGEYSIPTRIKLLIMAAAMALILSFGLALTVAVPSAEAVNTCKDTAFTPAAEPPFGQQESSCEKGSTTETTVKHGKGGGSGSMREECVKHTGHGDVAC
jgi:hypothetical protein